VTGDRRDLAVSALQYGLGIVALGVLLTQVEFRTAWRRLSGIEPVVLLAIAAVTAIGVVARFDTWRAVIAPVSYTSLLTAGRVDLSVNFVNQLLPSRLSGRVAAPFILKAETAIDYGDATAAAGVHTAIYAIYYGLVSLLGVVAVVGRIGTGLLLVLLLSTGLYLVAGMIVLLGGMNLTFLDRFVEALSGVVGRLPRIGPTLADTVRSIPDVTAASADGFRRLAVDPGVWLRYAVGWAIALVVAPGIRVWLLFTAFGAGVESAVLLPLYLVAAYSITLLPLTPGGIGVTEATATAVFVGLGIPSSVAVPVVFLDRILGVYLPALAGWYPSLGLDLSSL
jgi:uncharacterized protein (TIRG00374 family)